MAVGTTAGLLDQQSTQAVFKHKILGRYLKPLATMITAKATDKRVVILDGFAGRGRYDNGEPASAELILRTALAAPQASIESVLIEKKASDYAKLKALVDEYTAKGVRARAERGNAADHLQSAIEQAQTVPLFMFLDPCGAGLPFADLNGVLAGARRGQWPPTEVLLNFNADLTRRTAGCLSAEQYDHPSLSLMDTTCGGDWWRPVALDAFTRAGLGNFEASAFAVVNEYARRLAETTGMHVATVPVRRRLYQQPVYHLVFLTRKSHGIWVFADTVAKAREDWMLALGPAEGDEEDGALFSFGDSMKTQLEQDQAKAQAIVVANLRTRLADGQPVRLVDDPWAVFGDAYGVASDSTVSKAVRQLVTAGEIEATKAKHLRDRVVMAKDAVLAATG